MIITLISWIYILFIFISTGLFISYLLDKIFTYKLSSISSLVIIGLTFSSIYAELFSLFYKIGKISAIILFCISIIGLIISRKLLRTLIIEIKVFIKQKGPLFVLFLIVILVILGAYLSSKYPGNYDTDNYHAPSIRWIEKYGTVKGLGNLHTRFAYNSSFLCLQALFSFSWLCGKSLHSMNGFLFTFMLFYSISGLWLISNRQLSLSDLLKLVCIFILCEERSNVASPNTDFMPLCLSMYVVITLCHLFENKNDDPISFSLLAILGLFAASVKLSAGFLFLIAIKPLIEYLQKRNYQYIFFFTVLSLLVILPFILRNMIISGYIIYPVAQSGIFDFDWKIPKSVVVSDNVMIKVFARAWGSEYGYEDIVRSFFEWFSIWMKKSNSYYVFLGFLDLILSGLMMVYYVVRNLFVKKVEEYYIIPVIESIGFLFLMFTAPSVRFGKWWFWALPITIIYLLTHSYPNIGLY